MGLFVSERERELALNYCKKFLDGAWEHVDQDEVNVTAVSGGMTNLLYRCALIDKVNSIGNEPRQVLLRLYGSTRCNIPVQVEIFNQLYNAGLGPKLHSSFQEGRFEEYMPSSPLSWSQMVDDSISQIISRKIASIHKLDVRSLTKTTNWTFEQCHENHEAVQQLRTKNSDQTVGISLATTRAVATQMMAIDFNSEINFIENLLKHSKSPVVFSHNDLHQNNIIFLHQSNMNLEDRVVLIDFEYSSYNYLTFDLANHLSEWCFDYNGDNYPNFNFSLNRFPSEARQRQFLTYYVMELNEDIEFKEKLFGTDISDSDIVELLLSEMLIFFMSANLIWSLWAIKSALTSKIQFGYWEMSKCKWEVYMICKQKLNNDRYKGPSSLIGTSAPRL